MTFVSPLWLLGLLLVPVALGAYLLNRRRARRYAIRFPAVETLRIAALGTKATWRRHLPAVLALAAIGTLSVALARPHVSVEKPIDQASVVLIIDHSGSMAATDVQPTRLAAAQHAANVFIDQLPGSARVGVIGFSDSPDIVQGPVTNHGAARMAVAEQQAGGATATGDALELALQLLRAGSANHPPAAIVLLSDGAANAGLDVGTVARQAAHDKVPIYTVALGTPNGTLQNPQDPLAPPIAVPPDPQLMQEIAQLSGGRAFNAQSADELSSIYRGLGKQIGSVAGKREVTAEFAIGGLVLLLLAAAGSIRWSGRLP
jgi:Ca-activated chloride channel family protein